MSMRVIAAAGSGLSVVTTIPDGDITLRHEVRKNVYYHYDLKTSTLKLLECHPLGEHHDSVEGPCNLLGTWPFNMDVNNYGTISKLMKAFKMRACEYGKTQEGT